MALVEPAIHSSIDNGLDPAHPWAWTNIDCRVCGTRLHSSDDTCVTVWVETASGGYCLPDYAAGALSKDGPAVLNDGYSRGTAPTAMDAIGAEHTPIDTEHGPCCFQCSQTAADSDYRVHYPCPDLLKAYDLLSASPPGVSAPVVQRVLK